MDSKTRLWRGMWMLAASAGVAIIVFSLVSPSRSHVVPRAESSLVSDSQQELAGVAGTGEIFVKSDSPLARHLDVLTVDTQTISYPLLGVTGSIVARVRQENEPLEGRWQFASSAVAGYYADWLKTQADIEFAEKQLKSTRELTRAQIERDEAIVARLRPLAPSGAIPGKELRTAEADLVQAKLQEQRDVFAAESALRAAHRQKAALERQFAQAGLEVDVLSRARDGMVLISANVPEAKISLVQVGQACEVTFYSLPGRVFSAHVEELGTVLSTERRTLRVLFDLTDDGDKLIPGLFADVEMGTDPRNVLLLPANSVLHFGDADYVFKQTDDPEHFRVTRVRVSESRGDHVEVLEGVSAGDRIVGAEAVLLKPLAVQSLAR